MNTINTELRELTLSELSEINGGITASEAGEATGYVVGTVVGFAVFGVLAFVVILGKQVFS